MVSFVLAGYFSNPLTEHNTIYSDSLNFTADSLQSADSVKVKMEIDEGKKLYKAKCKGCHALYSPKDFKLKKWKENLKEMKFKAKLTNNEYELILKYLSVNCKK
jgi:cytochrome c5